MGCIFGPLGKSPAPTGALLFLPPCPGGEVLHAGPQEETLLAGRLGGRLEIAQVLVLVARSERAEVDDLLASVGRVWLQAQRHKCRIDLLYACDRDAYRGPEGEAHVHQGRLAHLIERVCKRRRNLSGRGDDVGGSMGPIATLPQFPPLPLRSHPPGADAEICPRPTPHPPLYHPP